jgi:hypothetical protein
MSDPRTSRVSNKSEPSSFYVPVTPGSDTLAYGLCRGILCSEDGALKLTDTSGTARDNIPVQKGYNPLRASVINNPGTGSAPAIVVALY